MQKSTEKDIFKAIKLMIENEVEYDNLIAFLIDNDIDIKIVEDLFTFTPIVFCRAMLPQLNFPDTFIEKKGIIETRKSFYSIPIYNQIHNIVNKYLPLLSSKDIIKIASLSAEFKAINDLLLNGGKLEDVRLTESIILR